MCTACFRLVNLTQLAVHVCVPVPIPQYFVIYTINFGACDIAKPFQHGADSKHRCVVMSVDCCVCMNSHRTDTAQLRHRFHQNFLQYFHGRMFAYMLFVHTIIMDQPTLSVHLISSFMSIYVIIIYIITARHCSSPSSGQEFPRQCMSSVQLVH